MHGAGLVNSYFLREGSSFVEIFPCRTGAEHIFASFREPHRIEGGVFGLSLFVRNESLCTKYQPQEYEQDRDGAGHIHTMKNSHCVMHKTSLPYQSAVTMLFKMQVCVITSA